MTEKKKGKSSIPWEEIKTEYCAGATMRSLSARYSIDVAAISRKAKKEGWKEARQQINKKSQQRMIETIVDDYSSLYTNIMHSALVAAAKVSQGITDTDPADSVRIKQYTAILKDLKDIGAFKSDLDREEQMARIEKLRKDVEIDDTQNTIVVDFKGAIDEYLC